MFHRHKWSRWGPVEESRWGFFNQWTGKVTNTVEIRYSQRRTCEVCGKVERKFSD